MQRIVFIAGILGLLALSAGCGKTQLKPPGVDTAACDAPQKLNLLGNCVDCTANADCASTQQCNLITGTCEAIPPPPVDAGSNQTCEVGAIRCAVDGHAVQDCIGVDGGSGWQDGTECVSPQVCNPQTLTCAICIPGETICDTSDSSPTYQRCSNDGTQFQPGDCTADGGTGPGSFCHQDVPHQNVTDGGSPVAALGTCRVCQPNTTTRATLGDGGKGIDVCDSTGNETFISCYPTNDWAKDDAGNYIDPPYCEFGACFPGQNQCVDGSGHLEGSGIGAGRQTCNGDGTGWTEADCTGGTVCGTTPTDQGACLSPCDLAANSTSYVGCDYWGVLLSNSGLDPTFSGGVSNQGAGTSPSQFAFVVGNASATLSAHVSVVTNGISVAPVTVAPNSTGIVYLPWQEICGTGTANFGYHLTSDQPVTVYQFNPLASKVGSTYSYTNDASLLLPTHLLGTSYVVVAQDQISLGDSTTHVTAANSSPSPGLMGIVATTNNTHVTIKFAGAAVSTANTNRDECGSVQGNIAAQAKGSTSTFTLNAGQVLHFWNDEPSSDTPTCAASAFDEPGAEDACIWPEDFTGSVVTSNLPVAVFGGADCTVKPYTQAACNHIEEEMFPFSTWGKTYVGVKSQNYASSQSSGYGDFWRLVSACGPTSCPAGTTVTITPAIDNGTARAGSTCTGTCSCTTSGGVTSCTLPPLQNGQTAPWIEFQAHNSFVAISPQPVTLAQYFVSESEAGDNATTGDPSLVMTPPIEQWRSSYNILAPKTYAQNFVSLMVNGLAATSQVQVDGTTVTGWNQIATTGYYATVYQLSNSGTGGHAINGVNGTKVGVVVYGYDSYVSYGYTGGLDLQTLSVLQPGG